MNRRDVAKMKKIMILLSVIFLIGCNSNMYNESFLGDGYYFPFSDEQDEYSEIIEQPFINTNEQNTSSFALSSNTASYANFRSSVVNNREIEPSQIRIEELINYFKYNYEQPGGDDIFGIQSYIMDTPWNENTKLMMIGMQAEDIVLDEIDHNLVFLLDVSGSMNQENKLPLVQQSFTLLLEHLKPTDRVSIVTYAGSDKVILDGGYGDEKTKISALISDLYASGSTAGSKGINRAYELAEKHFIPGGNNRVILATDGDFNVGVSTTLGLENLITEKRESGIYLSILGFGYGNLKDNKMETLANKGNGNYAYIDTILEARKALIEDLNGTLYTVARDAKAQFIFNIDTVKEYRLLGYENRMLTDEEFENSETDAGEIGAGHQVTVVYEVILEDDPIDDVFGELVVRYKSHDSNLDESFEQKHSVSVSQMNNNMMEDAIFISAIIETALILRTSEYKGTSSLINAKTRIESLNSVLENDYKQEFLSLLEQLINRD
jgi:Ca-activated chloride channel homolog